MGIVEQYLLQLNTSRRRFRRSVAFLTALSLLVVMTVFWNLRQTGITIANDACCGLEEHQHTEECILEKVLICGFDEEETTEATTEATIEATTEATIEATMEATTEAPAAEHVHSDECYEITYRCDLEEHIHDFSCYSDTTADLENWDVWAASIPELTGNISEDIVLVAQSQLGSKESTLNFELAEDGETRNGITRYGQWYGNPYGAWSNMFTSFCLHYAGLTNVPGNSGAEKMQLEWENLNLYRHAGGYEPLAGDIVFLDKNQNGTPEATGVVVRYFDFILTVIEGDVDNTVVQTEYRIDDPAITGYGITNAANRLMTLAAGENTSSITIGTTANYSNVAGTYILYATIAGTSYAIDHNGDAVPITISDNNIIADVADPTTLYWVFEGSRNAYTIRNAATTSTYLSPGANGLLSSTNQNLTLSSSSSGAKFRTGNTTTGYYVQMTENGFGSVQGQNNGSVIYFGNVPAQHTLWLDGTNGNIISCRGSDDTKYTVYSGIEMQLPTAWKSPSKYHYKLAGWVNIKTGDYYAPGDMISITEDTVLYADWVAATYDIGEFNSYVADTISTKDFITTRVFDYSPLINLLSSKVTVNASESDHTESWSHVASGNVTYKGQGTLDFSFDDQDSNGTIASLNSVNNPNKYTGGNGVYRGIYTDRLGEVLFSTDNLFDPETGEGIVGKHYLGEGDYLFQIDNDPTSEYYGYYYYNADLNAAAYNQSAQRFYVYDYLVKASDSGSNDYSDFLPLNSVYANNNGQTVKTYSYNGMTNYSFESKDNNNSNAQTNLWFGMSVDVQFGLPEAPGELGADGVNGNKDIYGKDMHFHFIGDDDVWILIDGKVVLDMGGIHQAASGDINFVTGEVRVNGSRVNELETTLKGIGAGEHTLSILYLERGGSMSNCAIYFNLAPRFSLTLQKEDVLTQEVLNNARFQVYTDEPCPEDCTGEDCYKGYDKNYHKAQLWPSQQAYKEDAEGNATNVFTIVNGQAYIWGLSPSKTYYIKEIQSPGGKYFAVADGLIRITLDKKGLNSDGAVILEETDKNGNKIPITNGFTVHGYQVNEEGQAAYLSITNAQNWVQHTTSVYVEKHWLDSKNHTYDAVTIYLQVTDPNGTVRRIRQINLSEENNWHYTWTNLPMYYQNPETGQEAMDIPMAYSVVEAYVPGYQQSTEVLKNGTFTTEIWQESTQLVNGGDYVLKTNNGMCLSAVNGSDKLQMVEEATAKNSDLALWHVTTTISNNVTYYKLYNAATGRSLNYSSSRYFNAITNTPTNLMLTTQGDGIVLSYKASSYSTTYYIGSLNSNSYAQRTSQKNSAMVFYPMQKTTKTETIAFDGTGYRITNTPLSTETSVKVVKMWDHPTGDTSLYEKEQVTLKLFANGVDTGRTETVSLKNNWTVTFSGLPYCDESGEVIAYTVEETWTNKDWIPVYGEVKAIAGTITTYEISVTNRYRWTEAFELPSTGGGGNIPYILMGLILISAPLVYGLSLRRRYRKEARR